MKFAKRLAELEKHYPDSWRGTLLRYKSLKKILKQCKESGCGEDKQFFQELLDEVDRINEQFEMTAKAVLNTHQASVGCCGFLRRKEKLKLANGTTVEVTTDSVAAYSRLCIDYAKANAVGLRKIIKKHDKYCNTDKGMRLLRQFWSSESARASFLHSPLLLELAAVEMGLHEASDAEICAGHAGSAGNMCVIGEEECPPEFHCTVEDSTLNDEDLYCAICLDTLYKPVALGCGHMFCQDCLFKSCGEGNALGTARVILSNVGNNARCPKCRQRAVFKNALILKETSAMLQHRYPEYWKEREKEEIETTKKLREAFEKKRDCEIRAMGRFHPSLLLYS